MHLRVSDRHDVMKQVYMNVIMIVQLYIINQCINIIRDNQNGESFRYCITLILNCIYDVVQ